MPGTYNVSCKRHFDVRIDEGHLSRGHGLTDLGKHAVVSARKVFGPVNAHAVDRPLSLQGNAGREQEVPLQGRVVG